MTRHSAATELVDAYHAIVFRYLCRMTGQRDVAADLTQDVFVRAIEALKRDAPAERPLAWLMRIARNRWIDHLRSTIVRGQKVGPDQSGSYPAPQLLNVSLQQALSTLQDVDRDVFLLREVSGLSYHEIASVCGLTADAVRSRIHRARCDLRTQLTATERSMRG